MTTSPRRCGYLLAGNSAELMVMLLATLLGWPLPLLPIHLLWINLMTDGLPALALATDPPDGDVLSRPPRRPEAQLIDAAFLKTTAMIGGLTTLVTLGAFGFEHYSGGSIDKARDAAFTVLVLSELFRSFGARSNIQPIWQLGLFTNLRLLAVVLVSSIAQLVIHYVPAMRRSSMSLRSASASFWRGSRWPQSRSFSWRRGNYCAGHGKRRATRPAPGKPAMTPNSTGAAIRNREMSSKHRRQPSAATSTAGQPAHPLLDLGLGRDAAAADQFFVDHQPRCGQQVIRHDGFHVGDLDELGFQGGTGGGGSRHGFELLAVSTAGPQNLNCQHGALLLCVVTRLASSGAGGDGARSGR